MRRIAVWLLLCLPVMAQQALVPPAEFRVEDRPNDEGKALIAIWSASKSDVPGVVYDLSISESAEGPWTLLKEYDATKWFEADAPQIFWFACIFRPTEVQKWHAVEITGIPKGEEEPIELENGKTYFVRLEMLRNGEKILVGTSHGVPEQNLWNGTKTAIFLFSILFCGAVLLFIRRARKDPNLFVRRIPGLDAVDEAIGRATEMGKPVLYLNGLYTMGDISTIASVSILGRLSRRIAQYDSQILVPCYDPVVMPVCQEVVREAYIDVGRPDAFRSENIFFLTSDQFSYVAAVDGIMMRDKPAANFYMGYYFAESLLLAETGAATGAIQIAGTDSVTQLPFFIATCDYTLLGEELYAASAYLSREPLQLGSLKGQDLGKGILMACIVIGVVLSTLAIALQAPSLNLLSRLFSTY